MKVTIFTPTFNRADKLPRLYNSLLLQKNNDLEWLIIDDGSTDNTREIIECFSKEAKISLRYYYQENGGKHRAHNYAVKLAQGDYFLCVDSDDWLAQDAVSAIINVGEHSNSDLIFAYKENEKRELLSSTFPIGCDTTTIFDLLWKWKCNGEFTIVFNREFAVNHPFPEIAGENFLTESVLYDSFTNQASVTLLKQVITCCEYQPEGLTSNLNFLMKNNPGGFCLYFMQRIDLQNSLIGRWVTAAKYHAFCSFARGKKTEYSGAYNAEVKFAKPLGVLFRLYYRFFRGF